MKYTTLTVFVVVSESKSVKFNVMPGFCQRNLVQCTMCCVYSSYSGKV